MDHSIEDRTVQLTFDLLVSPDTRLPLVADELLIAIDLRSSFGSRRNREFGYGIDGDDRSRNFRQPVDHLSLYGIDLESEIMAMKNPPHPGRSLKENCLAPLYLNVTEAAKGLGVARHTLSRVLNGHAAGEGELVQCRILAALADLVRFGASAQRRMPDPGSRSSAISLGTQWRRSRTRLTDTLRYPRP